MPIASRSDNDTNALSQEPILRRLSADSKDSQSSNSSKDSLHSPKVGGARRSPGHSQNLFTFVDSNLARGSETPRELVPDRATAPMLNSSGGYWGSVTRRSHSPRTRLSPPSLAGRNFSVRSHSVRGRHSPLENVATNQPRSPGYDFRETASRRRTYQGLYTNYSH